ncbi:unnamed protein product [Heligmosomoides polygyrus]|uniref:Uncharacterized protein n=1 Tax=Heligmosomoides polygyrus TaxID=6339 RepID=A0A3P8C968_HELPZ|nr:unnamed protein product [Heligmosomoides polygyrus]
MIVSERFRDAIASVERFDDRLMKIVVAVEERRCHFFSAYAPQTEAKKAVKKEVAAAKAAYYADVSKKLETHDGERYFYRLAKARCRQAENNEKFFGINDENGHLLMDRKRAVKRWHDYFEEVSNVEFDHPAIPFASPVYGPVQKILVSETEAAPKKMKSGKATAPDDLPADLWMSKGWCPADWLTVEFFNQVVAEKKVLES